MRVSIKRLLTTVVVVSLLSVLAWAFLAVSRPSVEVTIGGAHNPLENRVLVDETPLYPSGQGGTIYKDKAGIGSHTIRFNGPFIESQEVKASLSFFAKEKIAFESKTKTPEAVAKEIINDSSGSVEKVRVFDDIIVFSANVSTANNEGETQFPIMAHYSGTSRKWERLDSVSLTNAGSIKITAEAVDYFYELDGE